MIPRLALVATFVLALSGLAASSALAQNSPTVGLAKAVGPESAVLNGTIDTTDVAGSNVCYSFEYDTISDWLGGQDNAQSTTPVCVPTGTGSYTVPPVEIGCYPALSCSGGFDSEAPLDPGALYEYTLSVDYEAGGSYLNAEQLDSLQGGFVTPALGSVQLISKSVAVKSGVAKIGLLCNSTQACKGSAELIVFKKGKKLAATTLGFSIRADRAVYIKDKLSAKIKTALKNAKSGTLNGRLSVVTILTDQNVFASKPVVLAGS